MSEQPAIATRRRDVILEGMEIFREEIRPRSLLACALFLYVCENEGLTVSELAHVAGLSVSMAARVVKAMAGETRESPRSDRALVALRSCTIDKRLKLVYLTPRGRRICNRLDALISAASPIRTPARIRAPATTPQRGHAAAGDVGNESERAHAQADGDRASEYGMRS